MRDTKANKCLPGHQRCGARHGTELYYFELYVWESIRIKLARAEHTVTVLLAMAKVMAGTVREWRAAYPRVCMDAGLLLSIEVLDR